MSVMGTLRAANVGLGIELNADVFAVTGIRLLTGCRDSLHSVRFSAWPIRIKLYNSLLFNKKHKHGF